MQGPVFTSRGGMGLSIAARYFCSILSGAAFIAIARRAREACRLVMTLKPVPSTLSKITTGRFRSRSIFTMVAVISCFTAIGLATVTKSSAFAAFTLSR